MKCRTGFVSNSSSSSFMAIAKGTTKLTIEVDLARLGTVATTLEKLEDAVLDQLAYGKSLDEFAADYPYGYQQYIKAKAAIQSGHSVIVGCLSNDSGNDLCTYLYNDGIPESDNIEVLLGNH